MHYTLFDHCSVVLQTRLPMRDIQLHSVVYCWEVYFYLVYYPRDNSPQATCSSSLIGVPGGGVELLKANPQYSHIRLPDVRETVVSIRHLAPHG